MEAYQTHSLAWAFKTSLRGHPVPSWAVQILYMGFTGFPRNPRDTALSLFLSFFSSTLVPRSQSVKDCNKWHLNRDLAFMSFRTEWLGLTEVGKSGFMGQVAGKPHHFSTLLHHLFKVQGLSVSCQRIEACLQTVAEHNPWFPDEGSFDLEI